MLVQAKTCSGRVGGFGTARPAGLKPSAYATKPACAGYRISYAIANENVLRPRRRLWYCEARRAEALGLRYEARLRGLPDQLC